MRTFLVLCAVAGLSGCAVYPAPGYDTYGNAGPPGPYVVEQPVYLYGGGTVYRSGDYPYGYPRGYQRSPPPPQVVIVPVPRPVPHFVQRPGRRDRDGDGIPNRVDRDRDGDGIPNRLDRNPNNPNPIHNPGAPSRLDRSRDRDGDGIPNRLDPRPDFSNRR